MHLFWAESFSRFLYLTLYPKELWRREGLSDVNWFDISFLAKTSSSFASHPLFLRASLGSTVGWA